MGVIGRDNIKDAIYAVKEILKAYDEQMKNLKDEEHDKRVIKYSGMVMIYRVTGSSPAPYIKPEVIHLVKETGFCLIINEFEKCFDSLFRYLAQNLTI